MFKSIEEILEAFKNSEKNDNGCSKLLYDDAEPAELWDKAIDFVEKKEGKRKSYWFKYNMANRDKIPNGVMYRLANDLNFKIRAFMADRKDLPFELIMKLAKDRHPSVVNHIASRSDIPVEMIVDFARSKRGLVRQGAAFNKNIPMEVLKTLFNDRVDWVVHTAKDIYKSRKRDGERG